MGTFEKRELLTLMEFRKTITICIFPTEQKYHKTEQFYLGKRVARPG